MRQIKYIKHASDYQGNVVGFVNSWINLLGRAVYGVPLGKDNDWMQLLVSLCKFLTSMCFGFGLCMKNFWACLLITI